MAHHAAQPLERRLGGPSGRSDRPDGSTDRPDGSTGLPDAYAVRADAAPTVATDCPLAALQIAQGTGTEPRHPIQVLAQAYGLDEP